MKIINKLSAIICLLFISTVSCSDFEEINKDPSVIDADQTNPEAHFNTSLFNSQQDPHIAERMFILTWKRAARFERGGGITLGEDNNGWVSDYAGVGYTTGWINSTNQAIKIGEKLIASGKANSTTRNYIQMARIWRAYLLAESASGFGPITIPSGDKMAYSSEKDVWYYVLAELKDASNLIDVNVNMSTVAKSDIMFAASPTNWKKYANSLRLRYAMLLTNVDNAKAKSEVEDVVSKGSFILTEADIAQVAEKDGWSPLSGVMSRPWNPQPISVTYNNLVVGLGGQKFPVVDSLKPFLKNPALSLGLKLDQHMPLTTNDPCAGYFFNGIPEVIDPRAPRMFNIPGYDDKNLYFNDGNNLAKVANLVATNKKDTVKVPTKYSWSAWVGGNWDEKGSLSADLTGKNQNYPRITNTFRKSTNKKVWFAAWETYFLLAEASLYGWNTGGTAQSFYENGVRESFKYHKLSNADAYLASENYNRVGTSVSFTHTAEPTAYQISYVDGYTKNPGTVLYTYPKNSIYKNGTVNNDQLTKIITQKYLAQMPWLPLEAWSDHRRLGLPFMENPAVEKDYTTGQIPLTVATSKECKLSFYPKRYRYPSNLATTDAENYAKLKQLLGGPDLSSTPLWWCLK